MEIRIRKAASLFIAALLLLAPVLTQAITVTNTNDSGAGSLRAAVAAAANGAVIDFDPALIASGSATITLSSVINITTLITINGLNNATDTLYISGNSTVQIFNINTAAPPWTAKTYLNDLTLINGRNTGSYGGAIYCVDGSLEVNNCVIRNCSARWGGAIAFLENNESYAFVLTVNNCSLYGNTVTRHGGAIYCSDPLSQTNTAEVIINGSTIYNNNATLSGSAVYCGSTVTTTLTGGGDARATVRINKSTICNNLGTSAIHLYAEYSNNSVSTARSYLYLYQLYRCQQWRQWDIQLWREQFGRLYAQQHLRFQ
jgi:predicted outer membrane repeat protein